LFWKLKLDVEGMGKWGNKCGNSVEITYSSVSWCFSWCYKVHQHGVISTRFVTPSKRGDNADLRFFSIERLLTKWR
jgi:hypothetical protein